MRIRQILLAHPNHSIRALIKKYVFSELSDVGIVETDNGKHALAELNLQSFDVVIVTALMDDISTRNLRRKAAMTDHNATTPFIVLFEDNNTEDQDRLVGNGFKHAVHIRLRPWELISKINELCNPRLWRKDKRYHIHSTGVSIQAHCTRIEGSMINISRGGILVETATSDAEDLMKSGLCLALHLPAGAPYKEIDGLTCRLQRMKVTAWHLDFKPIAMRLTFVFQNLSSEKIRQIDHVLQFAKKETLHESAI